MTAFYTLLSAVAGMELPSKVFVAAGTGDAQAVAAWLDKGAAAWQSPLPSSLSFGINIR